MKFNFNSKFYRRTVLSAISVCFMSKFITDKRLNCFNDFDNTIKKKILNTKTDLFLWGNGYINDTANYTNFHPHRIKQLITANKLPADVIDMSFNDFMAAAIDKNFNLYVWKEPKLNSEKDDNINNHVRENVIKVCDKFKVTEAKFTKDKLFILSTDGNVYLYNIKITIPRHEQFFEKFAPEPIVELEGENLIQVKELKNIVHIATGKDHFIALDKNGKLYGMGDDSFGQLGLGNFSHERESQMRIYGNFIERRERLPKPIDISEKIVKVVCGENHTIALSEAGRVYGFGYNRYLQISNDELYRQKKIGLNSPTLINLEKFNGCKVVDIAASKNCSFFICKNERDGTYHFFSAGEGLRGTLGQNIIKHMSDVELMPDISGLINAQSMKPFEPLKLACGYQHCLLLFKNPRLLYVWGNNEFGELGLKDRVFYESPVPMLEEYNLPFRIINISANNKSSAFICEKVDKKKKHELLRKDQQIYEEQIQKLKSKKKKKKEVVVVEEVKEDEEKSEMRKKFEQAVKLIRKYI
jgi:alpha-tubulin suppressor-like RCC1 family protein